MFILNFGIILLLQTIGSNFANAGSISIGGVDINWTYGSTSTTFTVTSTLASGQPGPGISACIILMAFITIFLFCFSKSLFFIS